MPKPGWGAIVQGEPTDLGDWADTLKEPFDPWEIHRGETVLRSASLDELASVDEVRDRALAHIERLNGVIALSQRARPIRFGGVIQFTLDGKQHRTMFAEAGSIELRGAKARAYATAFGPDGKPLPPPAPQPSEVQRWAASVDDDELLDDAVMYFGKGADWFDIYKALECLFLRAGGEREFLALAWEPKREVERLKQTSNWARHAKRKFERPKEPMNVKDAYKLLGQLLRRALRGTQT